jgi:hypothetical protein
LSLTAVALLAVASPAAPQRSYPDDIAYDGRPVFVRLRWASGGSASRAWSAAWNHDYPRAEQHLSQIIRELTYLDSGSTAAAS